MFTGVSGEIYCICGKSSIKPVVAPEQAACNLINTCRVFNRGPQVYDYNFKLMMKDDTAEPEIKNPFFLIAFQNLLPLLPTMHFSEEARCPGLMWLHEVCVCEAGWMKCQILQLW